MSSGLQWDDDFMNTFGVYLEKNGVISAAKLEEAKEWALKAIEKGQEDHWVYQELGIRRESGEVDSPPDADIVAQ